MDYSPPDSHLSIGFPRQEYRSGLPFPSPVESSWPRDQTCLLQCRWIMYPWATRETHLDYLLLLLLSHFSLVRLCATPQTAAHQAPQSFTRPQEILFREYSSSHSYTSLSLFFSKPVAQATTSLLWILQTYSASDWVTLVSNLPMSYGASGQLHPLQTLII